MPGPPAVPREPSELAKWWVRTREAVGSDLAVHGLAYLGVLLFLVGAFGLVVFAFGDVAPTLRPLAEAVIATAPFAAAALLRRRGAEVVGRALEIAGGLVLPIMLITTFLDGVAFPPDLSGVPLVIGLTAVTGAVAAGYAVWSHLHHDSALGLLVAPVAWLAVGMASIGLARAIPEGKAVATPSAAQVAVMTAALVVTVAWARLRPHGRLAEPTLAAAIPGLAVIATLAMLTWVSEDGPAVPVLATGLLGVLALELLAGRLPDNLLAVLQPAWWAVAILAGSSGAVEVGLELGAVMVVAAAGFVAILESAHAARRPALAVVLPAVGAVLALYATLIEAAWGTVAFAAAAVWAAVRRRDPFRVNGASFALDVAAAALPVIALGSFGIASEVPVAILAASLLAGLATVLARGRVLCRNSADRYWTWWWAGACALTTIGVAASWAATTSLDARDRWLLVSAVAVLTVVVAVGPVTSRWRAPVVSGLAAATWIAAATVGGLSMVMVIAVLAVAGAAQVAIAHGLRSRVTALDRASLGLSGHALGLVALLLALPDPSRWLDPYSVIPDTAEPTGPSTGWSLITAVGVATVGWGLTGWLDAKGSSPVGALLRRLDRRLGWAPLSLAAAGLPLTTALALDHAGVLVLADPWAIAVPTSAALVYAAVGRVASHAPARVIAVAPWAAYLLPLLGVVMATESVPRAASLTALVLATWLTPARRRAPVMTWSAWLALLPAAWLLAVEYSAWFSSLAPEAAFALALVSGGSVLLVGGAAADLRGRAWTATWRPQHEWAVPPVVFGAVEVVAGTILAVVAAPTSAAVSDLLAWVTIVAAGATLATALLARAGALAGLSTVLAWFATLRLAEPEIASRPWIPVILSLLLLVAAQALSLIPGDSPPWARWDLPFLVAAAPVAATALVVAEGLAAPATFAAIGVQCLAVAIRLRHSPVPAAALGAMGTALVLLGAGRAGTGWLALALLALAACLTALAATSDGLDRTVTQIGGAMAGVAAWRVAGDWLGLNDQQAVDIEAVACGVIVLVGLWVLLQTSLHGSWARVWGGAASLVAAVGAWDAVASDGILRAGAGPSWWVTTGLLVVGTGLAAAARPLLLGWLRDVALAYGLGSVIIGLLTAGVDRAGQVVAFSVATVVLAALSLSLGQRRSAGVWSRPLVSAGTASTLLSLAAAFAGAPPMARVPALAAAAVTAAAAGVVLRLVQLQLASPVLAALAWIAFAVESLDGNPQWITLPLGLATLVVVGLWRRDRLSRGERVATTEIITLERLGIAMLVGPALVQAVTETLAYALLAAAIGLGVAAWGAITRVRRRVAAGTLMVLASLLLLVGVPLANLLPSWEGAGLWILIATVGLAAVLVASMVERGKAAVYKGRARLTDITVDWE
jgi:hypothetical protein